MRSSPQPLRIALIGMSGTGKSFWSFQLAANNFVRFGCDDMIERHLSRQIFGHEKSFDMGQWLGFPYDDGYHERERLYLAREVEVLVDTLDVLHSRESFRNRPVVIDTTGSVIHTGRAMLEDLSRKTTVVHLETPPEVLKKMRTAYLRHPRPVLWADHFRRRQDETDQQALARCYEKLLINRERQYRQYAHKTIGWQQRRNPCFTVDDLISIARG
ncbi:MAG: shikimate kinase [Chitinispirillaceae bacterium]